MKFFLDFSLCCDLTLAINFIFINVLFASGLDLTTENPFETLVTTPTTPPPRKWYNPEFFSKLTLPARELYGSRWIIENRRLINVSHSIEILDATLIHNNELTLRIEFNLRQKWEATGLEFPEGLFEEEDPPGTFVAADYNVLRYMWSPDSYISTSRESNTNTVGTTPSLVYIFKNMTIIFKVRMFTKVACTSSFQWYPLDVQRCDLMIESYKYHDDIVHYQWSPDHLYRPVVVRTKRLFQYELRMPPFYDFGLHERGGRGKMYAFVRLRFTFERKLGNNIIQVYTPTTLVVVLSWFSFWLGLDAIPGRISLLVTCMLTLVTMHSGIKSTIPPVHYITLMDVWLVCCMGFVFSSMCEFVVVKYLHWRIQQKQKILDRKMRERNREKLYSIMQQVGIGKGEGKTEEGSKDKVQQGVLQFATQKQNMYWNPSHKIAPNDILRSIVVEAVAREHSLNEGDKQALPDNNNGDNSGEGGEMDEENCDMVDEEECAGADGKRKNRKFPVYVKIDRFCRGFFPSLFCLFNAIYWPVLFNGTEDEDESFYTMND